MSESPSALPTARAGLLRSNLVVASGTALSRVTGLLRVFVLGYVLGQAPISDAYKLANETPNIVYDLLLGGVLSATLVPLFTSFMPRREVDDDTGDGDADRDRDGDHATNVVITVAATLMVALTAVAVAAAPLVFRLYSIRTPSDTDAAAFREAGTLLARIFLIQILFYGLTGVANAYLNSRRRFLAAAWSPVLSNLVIIATLLSLPGAGTTTWTIDDVVGDARLRWTLGLGATGGIAAMTLVVVPAMIRAGLRFRPAWEWRHPAVRRLLVLSGWTIGFVVANQIALLVIRNLSNNQGPGMTSAYFDAFTWFVLPHGLLAVSIATTFQPEMARAVRARSRADFVHHASLGTRLIVLLTVPAAAGMFALRVPIIGLMQRGQFDATAVLNTSRTLAGLSIGLIGFSVYLFVLRGFYAHQDTRTPFVLNVGENLLNIVFALVLVGRWGVLGLGLAYAFAYLLSAVWALTVLRDKVSGFTLAPIWSSLWRMLAAGGVMTAAMWFMTRGIDRDAGWAALVQVVVAGSAGVIVYGAVLVALRAPELDALLARIPRRAVRDRADAAAASGSSVGELDSSP